MAEFGACFCDVNQFSLLSMVGLNSNFPFVMWTKSEFWVWLRGIQSSKVSQKLDSRGCDGERFSFVFFDVTTSRTNSMLSVKQRGWDGIRVCVWKRHSLTFVILSIRWETVQCFLSRNEVGMELSLSFCKVNRFSAFCYTTRLGWDSCVCGNAIV